MCSSLRSLNLRWCRKMALSAILVLTRLQRLTHLSVSSIGRGLPKASEVKTHKLALIHTHTRSLNLRWYCKMALSA